MNKEAALHVLEIVRDATDQGLLDQSQCFLVEKAYEEYCQHQDLHRYVTAVLEVVLSPSS